MTEHCARCGAALPIVDGDTAAFCAACGLPQLRVSSEAVVAVAPAPGEPEPEKRLDHPRLDWGTGLRMVALVAAVGAIAPSLLPGAVSTGSAGGLSLLAMPLLTVAAVTLYHRSRPRREISPIIGGRLGATLGLMVGAWIALLTGAVGFVMRYHYHSTAMDTALQQGFDSMMVRMQEAGPQPPELIGFIRSPEFLAGSFLMGHVFSILLLVMTGTVCGWLAGALLRSRRQRLTQ